jgi:uncharacterized DUF497 family protein
MERVEALEFLEFEWDQEKHQRVLKERGIASWRLRALSFRRT